MTGYQQYYNVFWTKLTTNKLFRYKRQKEHCIDSTFDNKFTKGDNLSVQERESQQILLPPKTAQSDGNKGLKRENVLGFWK